MHEVRAGVEVSDRRRAPGGGAKPAIETQPGLLESLDELVYPETRGTPMSDLRWTSKSTYELADELVRRGFQASAELVRRLLHQMGYSLQAPAKAKEGTSHPDRDAQFGYLNKAVSRFVKERQPVISVDTKKKELIGEYANGGREWHPQGEPTRVGVHDFVDPEVGRAIPYGIYDVANDEGWVSVGDTADTAEFAVESIRRWWTQMGADRFPDAAKLLITADAGRIQRLPGPSLEGRAGQTGPRDGPRDHRRALPAGNVEVEQDRAPHVLLHHDELAGSTAHRHPHDRRTHRGDQDQKRPHGPGKLRPRVVSNRGQGH